jgi:hypothetical protein
MFVLPLSKPGGYMNLLLNWQVPLALLTSVEEYRRFGAGAPPHMSITHYTGGLVAVFVQDRPLRLRMCPWRGRAWLGLGPAAAGAFAEKNPAIHGNRPPELAESKGLVLVRGDIMNDLVINLAEVGLL